MKENFDCTQFLAFDLVGANIDIKKILNGFYNIGFNVIFPQEVRLVKREYFKEYIGEHFIELRYDNFMGEFEDWEVLGDPPQKILEFSNEIETMVLNNKIRNLRIILTSFAQKGYSTNEVIKVKLDNIREGMFAMSKHNYDIWVDNLIIKIV